MEAFWINLDVCIATERAFARNCPCTLIMETSRTVGRRRADGATAGDE